jgi:hypothetical protein
MENNDKKMDRLVKNNPGMMNNQLPVPGNMMLVYPEIYYKLQPFIMMVCDQMDTFGSMMPTQEMIEQMTDSIYDDVKRMYPEIAEYARETENKTMSDSASAQTVVIPQIYDDRRDYDDRDRFRRRFRRRGMLRDLIDILLLSEFARRRRRY